MGRDGSGVLTSLEEARATLLLRNLPGVGDRKVARLIGDHGSARALLSLPGPRLEEILGGDAASRVGDRARRSRVDEAVERAVDGGMELLPLSHLGYPPSLRHLHDPPPLLFLCGDTTLLTRERIVTVVGARRATGTARRFAERMSGEWTTRGVLVASGMALGVDAAAHRGALQAGGPTLAVLGTGVDTPYPRAHRGLFQEVAANGLLVSEFLPGEGAAPHHFPRRNRILAALAGAVVVVEAAARSGALITVDHALDLGREIFSVPGGVESPQARGSNALLRDGAHPLLRADDLIRVMGWGAEGDGDSSVDGPDLPDGRGNDPILRELSGVPLSIEALATRAAAPIPVVLARLTELELAGEVVRGGDGWRLGDAHLPTGRGG